MSVQTLLNAVSSSGAGSSISTARNRNRKELNGVAQVIATDSNSPPDIDGTCVLQGSVDDSNWFDVYSFDFDEASASTGDAVSFDVPEYLRGNMTTYASGSFTLKVSL